MGPVVDVTTTFYCMFQVFERPSFSVLMIYIGVIQAPGVSDVNRHLEQLFYCSMDNMFDIRLLPMPLGRSLADRLSETLLSDVKEHCGALPQQWHAWVKREDESLLVLLLPATVWPCNGASTYLPAILLLCKPEFLLQPYPNEATTVVLPEDELLLCIFESPSSRGSLHLRVKEKSLEGLIEGIRGTYIKCFLQSCYYRLCHSQELNGVDVRAALELCSQASTVIDYETFLEHICAHCTTAEGNALQTIPHKGDATCQTWMQDLQEEFAKILAKNHLHEISLCPGFYYYQVKETHSPTRDWYAQMLSMQSCDSNTSIPVEYGPAEPEATEETETRGTDAATAKDGSGTAVSDGDEDEDYLGEDSEQEDDLQIGALFSDDDMEPSTFDLTALDPPLFVHFSCMVQVENSDQTKVVDLSHPIPTCLGKGTSVNGILYYIVGFQCT